MIPHRINESIVENTTDGESYDALHSKLTGLPSVGVTK